MEELTAAAWLCHCSLPSIASRESRRLEWNAAITAGRVDKHQERQEKMRNTAAADAAQALPGGTGPVSQGPSTLQVCKRCFCCLDSLETENLGLKASAAGAMGQTARGLKANGYGGPAPSTLPQSLSMPRQETARRCVL